MAEERACAFVVAGIALHDLGKFGAPFIIQRPDLLPATLKALDRRLLPRTRHTDDGMLLWECVLRREFAAQGWPSNHRCADVLMSAVFGHHGVPAHARETVSTVFGETGVAAATECTRSIFRVLGGLPEFPVELTLKQARIASWWVAGMCSLADWVGSNQTWFEYTDVETDLDSYWSLACQRAGRAVAQAGLACPKAAARSPFRHLTGKSDPTPTQTWADQVELPTGPVLVIIEDLTGSGKTEAAQVLVHRLMAAGRASGAYWAMPTQATANAMFARQGRILRRLYADGAVPSLVLAHGQARFHAGFRETIIPAEGPEPVNELDPILGDEEDPATLSATSACAAFLADDRRAGLLADVGAGTVDQAFLAVLPSRFNCVRLVGLSGKVLVMDEAHGYDAYMGVEAETLLAFHAALGGNAIILSATLPAMTRRRLVDAWRDGVGVLAAPDSGLFGADDSSSEQSIVYPLGTVVSSERVVEYPLSSLAGSSRNIPIELVSAMDDAARRAVEAGNAGAAVAWVRNTVDDCLAAAAAIRSLGAQPLVFHARFAQSDRQAREREIVDLFGPDGSSDGRRGQIVVATQVIEQSLDLDFDFMISDLAPMDLLIQRAGRLWRHRYRERPDGLPLTMVVLAPDADIVVDKSWPGSSFGGTKAVYKNLGVLWKTLVLLRSHGSIQSPGCIRALVESAYDLEDVPESIRGATDKAMVEASADAAWAGHATLRVTDGYEGSRHAWESDLAVLTRLGLRQTTLRLARVEKDGRLVPWAEHDDDQKAWALCEVRYSAKKVPFKSAADPQYARAIEAIRRDWNRFEVDTPVLPLTEADGRWQGTLYNGSKQLSFRYSPLDGLALTEAENED